MSGLEIFSAIAAGTSIIRWATEVRSKCRKASEEIESLEKAKIAATFHAASLRMAFRNLAYTLKKYSADMENTLDKEDKEAVAHIIKDTNPIADTCLKKTLELRRLIAKSRAKKSEIDCLREEFNNALAAVQSQQQAFSLLIGLDVHRRVSIPWDGVYSLRRGTPSSGPTLGPCSLTGSTDTSNSSPRGSIRSDTGSSTSSISFCETTQLHEAIIANDMMLVQRAIKQGRNEDEARNLEATALLLACQHRKKVLVKELLTSRISLNVTNPEGLGVMHITIGTSNCMDSKRETLITEIVDLLLKHNVPVDNLDEQKERKHRKRPLHYCALTGNYSAAALILQERKDVINHPDEADRTALYHACEHHSPNERLIKLLLAKGATFGKKTPPKMDKERDRKARRLLEEEKKKKKKSLVS